MSKFPGTESKHFKLQPLVDGIYAVIAEDGGSAICNAGLIDLGGLILIFDTFMTPQAATDMRQAAIDIFGHPPQIAINSHYHNDHIWGNQVFTTEAQIISSNRTRELITTAGMEEFQWYSKNSTQKLSSLKTQYPDANEEQQKQMQLWLGYYTGLVDALPTLKVCLPSITFERQLELHGAYHNAYIITYENAHTHSDSILYLPELGIVFMGDLLFVNGHPYLGHGDPGILLNVLREVSQLDAKCFVPGHGPVGTITDVKLLIEYIEDCTDTATRLVKVGHVTDKYLDELNIDVRFQNWIVPHFYRTNIEFLCKRLGSSESG
jgi:cyclase